MYRTSRQLHRWVGIVAALFLLMVATTGFLLANKSRWAWMRPPVVEAQKVESSAEIVSVERAADAAFALGHPDLKTMKDVDRVDYRPKSNVFKVISKNGYQEVQVDGKTGAVLSQSFRNDQLTEDLHDLSFFGDLPHDYFLPLVALALFALASSGIGLFFTPVVRRWQFNRRPPGTKGAPGAKKMS
ncbi:MAG: PepSY domain-containing protein [Fimbriimonas sp.]